jgi:YVTN family beta-propeller protein
MRWVLLLGGAVCAAGCGGSTSASPPGADGGGSSGTKAYVTVYGLDEVAVIDTSSRAVVDHIPLGAGRGPAILLKTPDGKKLYAAGWKDNTITSVDVATRAVTAIPLGSRPWVEAMSPQGDVVYAGLDAMTIAVISTATDTVTRMIDTGGLLPESIIVSPDGATLYVAAGLLAGTVQAFSASTGAMVHAPIGVGTTPAWISISADGSKVYTLNFISSDVSVVDTQAWSVSSTIAVGNGSEPIIGAASPSGPLLVTNFGAANVVVVDPATGKVTHTLAVDGRPVGVDVSSDGTRAYVTDFGHASLAIAPDPTALTSGDLSSAIGPGPGEVVVLDPTTGAAVGDPIEVGAGPTSVVVE